VQKELDRGAESHSQLQILPFLCATLYKQEGRGFRFPVELYLFFNLPNPSSRTITLGLLIQLVTELNTGKLLRGVKRRVMLTTPPPSLIHLLRKCGILDVSQS
jgi:hypothetical protein